MLRQQAIVKLASGRTFATSANKIGAEPDSQRQLRGQSCCPPKPGFKARRAAGQRPTARHAEGVPKIVGAPLVRRAGAFSPSRNSDFPRQSIEINWHEPRFRCPPAVGRFPLWQGNSALRHILRERPYNHFGSVDDAKLNIALRHSPRQTAVSTAGPSTIIIGQPREQRSTRLSIP